MAGNDLILLRPDWDAPAHIHAVATTRVGGISTGAYAGLNLGHHVGDSASAVIKNRNLLSRALVLPAEPCWLEQVHGICLIDAAQGSGHVADGASATARGMVCTVLTADCLPVLLCDREGSRVAAVHAGWRGLHGGIIQAAVHEFVRAGIAAADMLAWLGPAIGPDAYEVGPELYSAFCTNDPRNVRWFRRGDGDRWFMDIGGLARQVLRDCGITAISGGEHCTFSDERFYSFRRDGITGRQATLIWMQP